MQTLPIYLYSNKLDVILDLDFTTRGANRVMYQNDLKVQKGIKNKIRVQFKNSDQKRIPISNTQTFVFSMFDASNQMLMLEKQLVVIDDGSTLGLRGLAELILTESDTLDLPKSSYQYSIKYQDPADGTYLPAYSNTYYNIAGTLQLLEDTNPVLKPSQEVVSFQHSYNQGSMVYQFTSGDVYAYPEFKANTALHTAAIYMTNFKGTVYVQGTLDNSTNMHNYYTIATLNYNGFKGVDYLNWNGVYSYVRFKFVPAKGPTDSTNNNPAYYGSLDKVLYRS